MNALKAGDQVTVRPVETDEYILNLQRYATVTRAGGGYDVRLDSSMPPIGELGPIPLSRLTRGWRNESGQWR